MRKTTQAHSRAEAQVQAAEQQARPDRAIRLHLKLDRNQCPECGLCFRSTYAFDKHRAGPFGSGRTPAARRCLLPHEMREKGMACNALGLWVSERLTQQDVSERMVGQP